MKILHVVAGLARSGGGLSELIPSYAAEVARLGHCVTLATVAKNGALLSLATEKAVAAGVKLVRYAPARPNHLFFSFEMFRRLGRLIADNDVVHVHSNWTFPVWWACHLALRYGKRLVMSPHGCIEPVRLKKSACKKRIAGWMFDRRYMRRATVVHATSQQEAEGINDYMPGLTRVTVVPSGVHPEELQGAITHTEVEARWPDCKGRRIALFLSRIHPLKGLDSLITVWSRLEGVFQDWQVVIAGPSENGYEDRLRSRVKALGLTSRVTFCGPLYGADKAMALRSAALFVLPSHNENFGIVVAEALACGVPVITTKGTPWSELLGQSEVCGRCGWWIDIGEEPLAEALGEAMNMSDEQLQAMGKEGQRLIEARYQWPAVSRQMEKVYQLALTARSSNGDMQ